MSRAHNRYGWTYWTQRERWWAGMLAEGIVAVPCSWCGELVDLSIKGSSSRARSVDHSIALARGGPLLDVTTWRVMHKGCNTAKGTKAPGLAPARRPEPEPSRRW